MSEKTGIERARTYAAIFIGAGDGWRRYAPVDEGRGVGMSGETLITVVGNLTADPELRFTPSGAAVANFTVASTPRNFDRQSGEWKDGDALFMRCNVWRQAAENVTETLTRGMRVMVTGRLWCSAPTRPVRARSAPSWSWTSTRSARRSSTPPRR
jgi:hypothetical protein